MGMLKKTIPLIYIFYFGFMFTVISSCKHDATDKNPGQIDTENSDQDSPKDVAYSPQGDYNDLTIRVKTDRPGAIYAKGDSIYFDAQLSSDGEPVEGSVKFEISDDGVATLDTGVIKLINGKVRVHWKQTSPMIVRCILTYKTKMDQVFSEMAAAAVSPYEIEPTAEEPRDFMEYWEDQKAKLSQINMEEELIPIADNEPGTKTYALTLANVDGSHVYANYSKPEGDGVYPAVLFIPGAGVSSQGYGIIQSYAAKGFLAIQINVHDLPNGKSASFYEEKKEGSLKNYYLQGRENRDTYYFNRVILGCLRAIDFLTAQTEWDQKHMVVSGSSQGGGLTIITTGLDSRVTAAAANVPALCDHSGRNFGRPSGWPQLVPVDSNGRLDPDVLEVSRYYDAVNFAPYIDVPVIFGVGLIDNTCHSTTVFSAYNEVRSSKEIDIAPLMGHAFSPSFITKRDSFIMQHGGK